MKNVTFEGQTLRIDGISIRLDYNIAETRIVDDLAIVILKFDELAPKHRQFQNCIAYDKDGKQIWIAEHPTSQSADSYVNFMDGNDNRLWNFGCFVCSLDFKTGKLLDAQFTK